MSVNLIHLVFQKQIFQQEPVQLRPSNSHITIFQRSETMEPQKPPINFHPLVGFLKAPKRFEPLVLVELVAQVDHSKIALA